MPLVPLNPWMLLGLLGVLIPIIIEILHRRRRRLIRFPAMRYLLKSEKQKKVRLQDLILLALRCFLCGLLGLALVRPVVRAGSALWAGGAERDVILVLDGTYSTGQRVGATSAFEVGKKMAEQIVRSMASGRTPRLTLVFLGHKAEILVERTRSAPEFAGQVERLRVSDGSGRMGEALSLTQDFVEREGVRSAEIYVISDLQKATWEKRALARAAPPAAGPAELLAKLAAKCRLFVLDTSVRSEAEEESSAAEAGIRRRPNSYLTRFEPRSRVYAAGLPVTFDVRVEGTGLTKAGAGPGAGGTGQRVGLTLYVNGQKRGEEEVVLRPAGSAYTAAAETAFEYTFQEGGEYVLKLVLESDSLPVDNTRYYLCRVPEAVRVLIFDEAGGGPPGEGASGYLARAIAPEPWPGFDRFTVFESTVRRPGEILREDLSGYAVVALAGLRRFPEGFVARLDQYVREGGRLLVFPGEGVEPYAYNSTLFRDGAGVLPARLAGEARKAEPGPRAGGAALAFSLAPPLHEALAHFKGRAKIEEFEVTRYVPLEAGKELESSTILRLTNGEPAVVERRVGRGRSCLVCTSVDGRWGWLPLSRDFPVLVQELLRHLVGDPDASVNLSVGGRFEQRVMLSPGHLVLVTPDGHKERVTPSEIEGRDEWAFSFENTGRQGLYRVDTIPEVLDRRQFVVNLVPEEGDLASFEAKEFLNRFGVGGLELLDSMSQVKRVVEGLHLRKELALALLWLLFVLLFVETYLAKRFGLRRV